MWRFMHIRTTLTASLIAAALATLSASPSQANILINIDKSTQRMSVSVDGQARYSWPVSTGRASYNTPNGTFHPFRMEAEHYSKEWDDAPMPHSIFFTKIGHAIHGTFEAKHLGSAASHGCVRLSTANATTLFNLVKQGGMGETTVVISGQIPAAAPAVARRRAPAVETEAAAPVQLAPGYNQGGYPPSYDQGYRQSYDQGYGRSYPPQPPPAYQPQFFRPFTSY
jgi:hypothetical protein